MITPSVKKSPYCDAKFDINWFKDYLPVCRVDAFYKDATGKTYDGASLLFKTPGCIADKDDGLSWHMEFAMDHLGWRYVSDCRIKDRRDCEYPQRATETAIAFVESNAIKQQALIEEATRLSAIELAAA